MAPNLVIFDCDGVLVDSEPVAARVLAEALMELGLNMSVEQVDAKYRGRSVSDIRVDIEAAWGRPLPADFIPRLNARTFAAFETGLHAVDGVHDLLEHISFRGIDVCVASSGTPEKIRHSLGLTKLAHFFEDRVFSASEVARGKPAPDLFLHAAAQMGHDISTSVVIEDSLPGVVGATAAGARVLGYAALTLGDHEAHARGLTAQGAEVFHAMAEARGLLELSE